MRSLLLARDALHIEIFEHLSTSLTFIYCYFDVFWEGNNDSNINMRLLNILYVHSVRRALCFNFIQPHFALNSSHIKTLWFTHTVSSQTNLKRRKKITKSRELMRKTGEELWLCFTDWKLSAWAGTCRRIWACGCTSPSLSWTSWVPC